MSRTSAKLRQAAHAALHEFQRPFTIPEFEGWLALHEPALWKEISRKCDDYVRVILSLTPETVFAKYRCISGLSDARGRATYYGAADGGYDPGVWAFRSKNAKRRRERAEPRAPATPPAPGDGRSIFFGDPVYGAFDAHADERACEHAWFALRTLVPGQHAFWAELARGIAAMRGRVGGGGDPEAALREVLAGCAGLTHGVVAADAAQILSWEAIRAQRERGSAAQG
jgi:hypothetical protein